MDAATIKMIREWVAMDGGDAEKTARWMSRKLGIAGVRQCRKWIEEAMAS